MNDLRSIYFALIKDPTFVLGHTDPIIMRKGYLMKRLLEDLDPIGVNADWWRRLIGHIDILKSIFETEQENNQLDTSVIHNKE